MNRKRYSDGSVSAILEFDADSKTFKLFSRARIEGDAHRRLPVNQVALDHQ